MDTLMFDYFELAKLARPKVVVAENIPALPERNGQLFEAALDYLRFASNPRSRLYNVNWVILSASNFGVAQERRRLFVVGIRKDVAEAVGINSEGDVLTTFPGPICAPVSIRSALDGVQQGEREIAPWRVAVQTSALGRIVTKLPIEPDKIIKPFHVGLSRSSWFSLSRCSWNLPAPTLTVMGQRPDGLSGALHPAEARKFTLPELKRLTGLPDDFVLTGTLGQASERICRMVPPLLIKALADSIFQQVLRPYYESKL
jgi:site-specific DNA-cytosine methylase